MIFGEIFGVFGSIAAGIISIHMNDDKRPEEYGGRYI